MKSGRPWPNTRRWASSWMTTVSSASGGARISRHEKASRPCREALPQRVRWSRTLTAVGLTPRAVGMPGDRRARWRRAARGLQPRLEDRRGRSPVRGGEMDDELVLVGAADPLDGRPSDARHAPARRAAGAGRRGTGTWRRRGGRRGRRARPDRGPAWREVAPEPRLALGEERLDRAARGSPSRVGWRAGR